MLMRLRFSSCLEHITYTPRPDNTTLFRQRAMLVSGFPTKLIARKIEQASYDRFKSNAGIGKQGFDWVLAGNWNGDGDTLTHISPAEKLKMLAIDGVLIYLSTRWMLASSVVRDTRRRYICYLMHCTVPHYINILCRGHLTLCTCQKLQEQAFWCCSCCLMLPIA